MSKFGAKKLTKRSSSKKSVYAKMLAKAKPKPVTNPDTGGTPVIAADPPAPPGEQATVTAPTWTQTTPQRAGTGQQPALQLGRPDRNQPVPTVPAAAAPSPPIKNRYVPMPKGTKKGMARPKGMQVFEADKSAVVLTKACEDFVVQDAVRDRVDDQHKDKVVAVIEALAVDGTPPMSVDELVDATNAIGATYDQLARGEDVTGTDDTTLRLALLIRETRRVHGELAAMITTGASLEQLPLPKARALAGFLQDNPAFVAYLNSRELEFVFRSGSAKGQGGGVYLNKTVHMDGLDDESPVTFLRLLLHESGHATFQRLLMPEDKIPGKTLPKFWDKGTAWELRRERDRLQQVVAGLPPAHPDVATLARIEQTLAAEDRDDVWSLLSPQTRQLYEAWTVLRQDGGKYLLGLNLGATGGEKARQVYQANDFTEFVAESFMHVATEAINDHLTWINTDPNVPDEALNAWATVATVLIDTANRQILRRE